MLTDNQVRVLVAVNDYCEIHGRWNYDESPGFSALPIEGDPELLHDEIGTALADLHELGLITGVPVAEHDFPVVVLGLTARGRQELPSG